MTEEAGGPAALEERTRALLRAAATLGQQAQKALGLGVTDLAALQVLDRLAGEPVPIGRLTSDLGLSSAATTELVDRLERGGLVSRAPDRRDRRRTMLVLQPAAQRVGEQLLAPWGDRIRAAARSLSDDDRDAVLRYLSRLLEPPND